jgi:type IV fimbrial biogenesis protein FimT
VTLIELMVVVALLGVLTSIAIPSFAAWIERSRLRSTIEGIHTGIQLARSEALTRNAPVRFTLQAGSGWSVACTTVGTGAGCLNTEVLHSRSGTESTGSFALTVNGAAIGSPTPTVVFQAQGMQDTTVAGRIQTVEVAAVHDSTGTRRRIRIDVSNFGRTRLCYPHGNTGGVTTC